MTKPAEQLWKNLQGFTPPKCPVCERPASLDQHGYWCERCSDAEQYDPRVDAIPNGAEFDELLAQYQRESAA